MKKHTIFSDMIDVCMCVCASVVLCQVEVSSEHVYVKLPSWL